MPNNILSCMVSSSTVDGCISVNIFSIRFVVLLASDRIARSSKFLLISASYLLF